jgi:alpha-glucosidase (family GH31 glycosyl hydrolase)
LTGIDPIQSFWAVFPEFEEFHEIDNQNIDGEPLLVAPVLKENATSIHVVNPYEFGTY